MRRMCAARSASPFQLHVRLRGGAVSVLAVVGLMAWAVAACGQQIALEAEITLGADRKVDIRGTVTASDLYPQERQKVSNTIEVYVEYTEAGGVFRTLPDSFWIRHGPTKDGKLLSADEQTGVKAHKVKVFEQKLVAEGEGKALDIANRDVELPPEAAEFRVVAFLNHTWSGTWPAWTYRYSVWRPFEAVPTALAATTASARDIMLDGSKTPAEWEVGAAGAVSIGDILTLMSVDAEAEEWPVRSSALQAVRIGGNALMVAAVVLATEADAKRALEVLAGEEMEAVGDEMVRVPATETGVYGMMRKNVVYLIAGENKAAAMTVGEKLVGSALSVRPSTAPPTPTPRDPASVPAPPPVPSAPPTATPPPTPAPAPTPPPTPPPTPAPTTPSTPPSATGDAAVELSAAGVVKEAAVCTGIDEKREPVGVTASFPPKTESMCLYLRICQAPADTPIRVEWSRNGKLLQGFTILVTGDQRALVDVSPNRGEYLQPGRYAIDLKQNDEFIGRLIFSVQ